MLLPHGNVKMCSDIQNFKKSDLLDNSRIQWRNYRVASRQNATGPQPEGAPGQRRIPTPNIYYLLYMFSKKSFVFDLFLLPTQLHTQVKKCIKNSKHL